MPKQSNYVQDITPFERGDAIWRFPDPTSNLISQRIADGKFGLDPTRDNIEIHLYQLDTNALVKSVRIPLTENYLYIETTSRPSTIRFGLEVWNPEHPEDSLLLKWFGDVPPGYYNMVVNFFSDELSDLDVQGWRIKTISPSRTEILVESIGQLDLQDLEDMDLFLDTSMFFDDFVALSYQTFNMARADDYQPLNVENYADFLAVLRSVSFEATRYLNSRDASYQVNYYESLKDVYDKIFMKITDYLFEEQKHNRFRITKQRFNNFLTRTIEEVVQENITSFPEGNQVTRAQ